MDLIRPDAPFPETFETDPVARIAEVFGKVSSGTVRPLGAATEAAQFAELAPTVVFGPGVLADDEGPVAHSLWEYVDLRDVQQVHNVLTAVETFCASATSRQ